MATSLNVQPLQTGTINRSAEFDANLGVGSRLTIHRDANTPAGDPVEVTFDTLAVGILSSITIDHASLTIGATLSASVLTQFHLGDSSTLEIGNANTLNILTPITFEGVGARLIVESEDDPSRLSAITGFNDDDILTYSDLSVDDVSAVTYANGRLMLMGGNDILQTSMAISGNFDPSKLGFQSNGHGGINIGVGLGAVRGDADDSYVSGLSNQYQLAKTPLGQLFVKDTMGERGDTQTVTSGKYLLFTDGAARFDPTGHAQDVAHIYQAAFDRHADISGLEFWTTQLEGGAASLQQVAGAFVGSQEFQSTYGSLSNASFVAQLYQNVLDRAGDAGGLAFWTSQLDHGTGRDQVLVGFAKSFENVVNNLSVTGDEDYGTAYRLYQAAFDRTPDAGGLNYWYGQLSGGTTGVTVANGFINSAEFNSVYGNLDNTAFVDQLYHNVLNREADQQGENYWVNAMQNGSSRADVLLGFAESLENRLETAAQTHDNWIFLG